MVCCENSLNINIQVYIKNYCEKFFDMGFYMGCEYGLVTFILMH